MYANKDSFPSISIPYLHEELSLISSFSYGCNHKNALFMGVIHPDQCSSKALSKWFTALHSSMFIISGSPLHISIFLPSFLIIFSFCILFYDFALDFKIHSLGCYFPPLIILFNSGFGIFQFFNSSNKSISSVDLVTDVGLNKNTDLLNPIFHIIFGTRSFSFVLVYSVLFFRCFHKGKLKFLLLDAFILDLIILPIHYQTFLGISIYALVFTIIYFLYLLYQQLLHRYFDNLLNSSSSRYIHNRIKQINSSIKILKQKLRHLAIFWCTYLVCLVFYFPTLSSKQFLRTAFQIEPIWKNEILQGSSFPIFSFWFKRYGIVPFALFFVIWFASKIEDNLEIISLLTTFSILNFWKMQPLDAHMIYQVISVIFVPGLVHIILSIIRFAHIFHDESTQGIIYGFFFVAVFASSISTFVGMFSQFSNLQLVFSKDSYDYSMFLRNKTNFLDNNKNYVNLLNTFMASKIPMDPLQVLAGHCSITQSQELLELANLYQVSYEELSTDHNRTIYYSHVKSKDTSFSSLINNLIPLFDSTHYSLYSLYSFNSSEIPI